MSKIDWSSRHMVLLGASKGIGRQLALDLAKKGVGRLTLVARSESLLNGVRKECEKQECITDVLVGDLCSEEFLQKLVHHLEDTTDEFPREWLFVAGGDLNGSIHRTPFESMDWEQCDNQIKLNTLMPMRLTHLILRELLRPGTQSHLVYLSSQAGFHARPGLAPYAASKWALNGFVKSLFHELRESDVKMSLVAPGLVDTTLIPQSPKLDRKQMIQTSDLSESIINLLSLSKNCCPLELHLYPQQDPIIS